MLEYAYYSVISPEGCAAILWRDGSKASEAANALKLTSQDLKRLGLVDTVVQEPVGGAHRNIHDTVYNVKRYIARTLTELRRTDTQKLLSARYKKWRSLGTNFTTRAGSETAPRYEFKVTEKAKPSKSKLSSANV
jgi:acetyl-CoA carboxylase carboxyl transferase subunit alpha